MVTATAGRPSIRCLLCGAVSWHPSDVDNKYCGRCHLFHEIVAQARALVAEGGSHECGEWRTALGACAVCGRIVRP